MSAPPCVLQPCTAATHVDVNHTRAVRPHLWNRAHSIILGCRLRFRHRFVLTHLRCFLIFAPSYHPAVQMSGVPEAVVGNALMFWWMGPSMYADSFSFSTFFACMSDLPAWSRFRVRPARADAPLSLSVVGRP